MLRVGGIIGSNGEYYPRYQRSMKKQCRRLYIRSDVIGTRIQLLDVEVYDKEEVAEFEAEKKRKAETVVQRKRRDVLRKWFLRHLACLPLRYGCDRETLR